MQVNAFAGTNIQSAAGNVRRNISRVLYTAYPSAEFEDALDAYRYAPSDVTAVQEVSKLSTASHLRCFNLGHCLRGGGFVQI